MSQNSFNAIIRLALSRRTLRDRAWYLVKGLAFSWWLVKGTSGKTSSEAAAIGQAGDDIYPLF